jgi:hypothetical protein
VVECGDDADDKEVGAWAYAEDSGHEWQTEAAEAFLETLPSGFTKRPLKTGEDVKEDDFEKASVEGHDWVEPSGVDTVDFAWFGGHGDPDRLIFLLTDTDEDGEHPSEVHYSEAEWGDKDLEWIFLYSCRVLQQETRIRWDSAFNNRLHGICGFHSIAWSWDWPSGSGYNLGWVTAFYLKGGDNIFRAWYTATRCSLDLGYAAMYRGCVWAQGVGIVDDYGSEHLPGYNGGMYDDPDYSQTGGHGEDFWFGKIYNKWSCE